MRLNDFQEKFKNIILDPARLDDDMRAVFRDDRGVCLENRLKIYRNNVIRNLADALLASMPMTEKLVGRDFLDQAIRAYVVQNLPAEGNINLYGVTFPDFIKAYEPAKNLPYLSDMTRLEWTQQIVYYAPDDAALDPAALAEVPHDRLPSLRFAFRESFALIESPFPLDEIAEFCRREQLRETLDIGHRGAKLMVFRMEFKVELATLADTEYVFLKALHEGNTIAGAAAMASDFDLAAVLQKYLGLGIFKGFSLA